MAMDSIWHDRARVTVELKPVAFVDLDYDEGLGLYCYLGSKFTGVCAIRYPDGELESVTQMVNGAENGVCVGWYTDGRIQFYRELSRGVRHGRWLEWSADGDVTADRHYERGRLVEHT
jgi:hypothetical protein